MIHFQCDYTEGAHPSILERLAETNMEQTEGYGVDRWCAAAREKIRAACGRPDADVHFLVGGTQANTTVIASVLRHHQGAISADAGHIATHETGAIEATGHKVLALPSIDGKIQADQIAACIDDHYAGPNAEHTVQPGIVYISFPTESGTIYSLAELEAISSVCRDRSIPLFIDGARLGYGLTSPANDASLEDIARLADVFYIGGTKCGALFGEAVVITDDPLKKDFRYAIKQHGGMLAKGRLLGIQFDALFTDGLYMKICKHAVDQAMRIRRAFESRGVKMFGTSMTNQQFPILDARAQEIFKGKYVTERWGSADGGDIIRFCTSWATRAENVDALIADIEKI